MDHESAFGGMDPLADLDALGGISGEEAVGGVISFAEVAGMSQFVSINGIVLAPKAVYLSGGSNCLLGDGSAFLDGEVAIFEDGGSAQAGAACLFQGWRGGVVRPVVEFKSVGEGEFFEEVGNSDRAGGLEEVEG